MPMSSIGTLAPESPGAIGSTSATRAFALVVTLLLRACVNAAFAVWLFTRAPVWLDIFSAGAAYALADGTLGLIAGLLLVRQQPFDAPAQFVGMILADAILRCGVGIVMLAFPGIPHFPITLVLFYAALGVWAAGAGVIAMTAWFVAHEREKHMNRLPSRAHALFDPLAVAGLIAFLLAGYAFIMGPPATAESLRIAAGATCGALALVFFVAALGAAAFPTPRGEA